MTRVAQNFNFSFSSASRDVTPAPPSDSELKSRLASLKDEETDPDAGDLHDRPAPSMTGNPLLVTQPKKPDNPDDLLRVAAAEAAMDVRAAEVERSGISEIEERLARLRGFDKVRFSARHLVFQHKRRVV